MPQDEHYQRHYQRQKQEDAKRKDWLRQQQEYREKKRREKEDRENEAAFRGAGAFRGPVSASASAATIILRNADNSIQRAVLREAIAASSCCI